MQNDPLVDGSPAISPGSANTKSPRNSIGGSSTTCKAPAKAHDPKLGSLEALANLWCFPETLNRRDLSGPWWRMSTPNKSPVCCWFSSLILSKVTYPTISIVMDLEPTRIPCQISGGKNMSNQWTRMISRKPLLWDRLFQQSVHFPLLPYECRLWSMEWVGVQSVDCKDIGVLSVECSA